jgi:hypothetical protein
MKKAARGRKKAEIPQSSLIPEDIAELVRRLNNTLWQHLPPHLCQRWPQSLAEERSLAILGARNCLRRINLDYPDDVLNEDSFAGAVKDLLEALEEFPVKKGDALAILRDYQERGFLIPRYRILYCARLLHCPRGRAKNCNEGCQDRVDISTGINRNFVYDGEHLHEIRFGSQEKDAPPIPSTISPVRYYREKGLLIETPRSIRSGSKQFRFSIPLFTFSQIWQVLKLHRALHFVTLNLLIPPKQYARIREQWLLQIKKTLEEIGSPLFCKNPTCLRSLAPSDLDTEQILRYGNLKEEIPQSYQESGKWPRQYCSIQCRQRALNAKKPPSTQRVQKRYTNGLEPFRSPSEPSLPHSVE